MMICVVVVMIIVVSAHTVPASTPATTGSIMHVMTAAVMIVRPGPGRLRKLRIVVVTLMHGVGVAGGLRLLITASSMIAPSILMVVEHSVSFSLQLDSNLAVDELQERVLIELVIEVVRLLSVILQPRSWHIELVLEVTPRVQNLTLMLIRHLLLLVLLMEHVREGVEVFGIE